MKTKIDDNGDEILDLTNDRNIVSDCCYLCDLPIKVSDNYDVRFGDGDEFFPFLAGGDGAFFHNRCFEIECLMIVDPEALPIEEKAKIYEAEFNRRHQIIKEGPREGESNQDFIDRLYANQIIKEDNNDK